MGGRGGGRWEGEGEEGRRVRKSGGGEIGKEEMEKEGGREKGKKVRKD